jgi:hypothetical protein
MTFTDLFARWHSQQRASLQRRLDHIEAGLMRTGSGSTNSTLQTAERIRSWLVELEELAALYAPSKMGL